MSACMCVCFPSCWSCSRCWFPALRGRNQQSGAVAAFGLPGSQGSLPGLTFHPLAQLQSVFSIEFPNRKQDINAFQTLRLQKRLGPSEPAAVGEKTKANLEIIPRVTYVRLKMR